MITSTRLEAQVVYFDLKRPLGSGFFAENWTYFCIPITIDHLKIAPILPHNCEEYFDEKQRQFLGYLSGLYGKGGDMEGWYGVNLLFCALFFFFFFFLFFFYFFFFFFFWMLMNFCFSYRKVHSIEGPKGNQFLEGAQARVIQVRELHQ